MALMSSLGLYLTIVGCVPNSLQAPQINPYLGVTAGASRLELDIESDDVSLDDSSDTAATIIAGGYSSLAGGRIGGELQLSDLGSAVLSSGDQVGYQTASATVLGSLFPRRTGANVYLKFGVGALRNDAPSNPTIELRTDNTVNLVTGVGAEYLFSNNFGVRLEYIAHDEDVEFGTLGVTYSFGLPQSRRNRQPIVRRETAPQDPVVLVRSSKQPEPAVDVQAPADADNNQNLSIDPITTELPATSETASSVQSETSAGDTDAVVIDDNSSDAASSETGETINVIEFDSGVEIEDSPSQPVIAPLPDTPVVDEPLTVEEVATVEEAPVIEEQAVNEESVEVQPRVVEETDDSDAIAITDSDGDGIADQRDICSATRSGIPVDSTGCDLYSGLLSGTVFAADDASLDTPIRRVLNSVVGDLERFPSLSLEVQLLAESASEADMFLARRRTIEILRFFRARGISGTRLKTRVPTTFNTSDEGDSIVFLRTIPIE